MVQDYASRIHAKIQIKLHLERFQLFYWKFIAISHATSQCQTMQWIENKKKSNHLAFWSPDTVDVIQYRVKRAHIA